jgi:hypothetical protein
VSDKPEQDDQFKGEVEQRGGDTPADYQPPGTWHLSADALDELNEDDDDGPDA